MLTRRIVARVFLPCLFASLVTGCVQPQRGPVQVEGPQTAKQQAAFLHASCTEWKNLFSFEIYGRKAKLAIDGLGGSYGVERLSYYKLLPEMGPPETTVWEYPMADDSWAVEFGEFVEDIRLGRTPRPGLGDAHAALSIVDHLYRGSGYDHHA